ncbi:hypothetical protein T484DRAFT_1903810 [Baffinella frigidus]|nr:hypothetical protein T484DRAFT_1903810 [Cryptophyta sp. CCMP2293]
MGWQESQVRAERDSLQSAVNELVSERDYYYGRLRAVEEACQKREDAAEGAEAALLKEVLTVMYSDEAAPAGPAPDPDPAPAASLEAALSHASGDGGAGGEAGEESKGGAGGFWAAEEAKLREEVGLGGSPPAARVASPEPSPGPDR